MEMNHCKGDRHPRFLGGGFSSAWRNARYGPALIGIASLAWFVIRTGSKPSRAIYPCQRAAAANASAWLATAVAFPPLLGSPEKPGGDAGRLFESKGARIMLFLLVAVALLSFSGAAIRPVPQAAAGSVQERVNLSLAENHLPAGTFSDIYAVQGTTGADEGFRRLVELMEQRGQSFYSLVDAADVVIIKVNSQWDERGGTNTDLVRAIVESLLAHPGGFTGEIVIADNGQGQYGAAGRGGSLDWKSNNAIDTSQSMQDVAEQLSVTGRVSAVSWDRITTNRVQEYSEGDARDGYVVASSPSPATGIIVSYPKFETRYGTRISFKRGIWDPGSGSYDTERLKVINVPVLKSHMIYGVTGSVKHYMGVVSDKLTGHNAHRSVGTGGMGTQMADTRFPVLNVMDAIWVNAVPGAGPRTGYAQATQAGIIAASKDPVALDYWAAGQILVPTAKKLGHTRTASLDPDGVGRGSFGEWLRLSMEALQEAGYPVTLDLKRINISVTSLEDFRLE
jgi:hypothetical protein